MSRESMVHVASAVSNVINAAVAETGDESLRSNAALRLDIQMQVESIVETIRPDLTEWANVKGDYDFYDKYLADRRREGSITEFDLRRPGLHQSQFSTPALYAEHMARLQQIMQSNKGDTKMCSGCAREKPKAAFRTSGSVCNACRSRRYRERKAAK